jgi:hypothetical protein
MENFKIIVLCIPKNTQHNYIRRVFKNLNLGHLGDISIKNYKNKKTCIVNIINLSQNGYDNLFLKLKDPNNTVEIDTLYGKWLVKQFIYRFKETIVVTENYYSETEPIKYDASQFYPLYFDNNGIW